MDFVPRNPQERAALRLACRAHAGQKDKCGAPYIEHPLRVAESLEGSSTEAVSAALLHDVLEDTPYTTDEIKSACGERVAELVGVLTHRPHEPYTDYIERVAQDADAVAVKLSDLEDNLSETRMTKLDEATQRRLRKKYLAARKRLRAAANSRVS